MEKYNNQSDLLTLLQLAKIVDSGRYELSQVAQAKINKFYAPNPNLGYLNEFKKKKYSKSKLSNLIYKPEFIKATLDAYEVQLNGMKRKTNQINVQQSQEIRKTQHPIHNYKRSRDIIPTKSLYQLGLIAGKGFNFDKLVDLQENIEDTVVPHLILNANQNDRPLTVHSVAMTYGSLIPPRHINIAKLLPDNAYNWDDLFPPCTPVPMNTPRNTKKENEQTYNFPETSQHMSELNKPTNSAQKSMNKINPEQTKEMTTSDSHSLFLLLGKGSGSDTLQNKDSEESRKSDKKIEAFHSANSRTLFSRYPSVFEDNTFHPNEDQDMTKIKRVKHITSSNITSSVMSSKDSMKVNAGSSTTPDVSIAGSDETPVPQPSTEKAFPPNERPPSNSSTPRNQPHSDTESGALLRSRTVTALRTRSPSSKRFSKGKGSLPIMPHKSKKS